MSIEQSKYIKYKNCKIHPNFEYTLYFDGCSKGNPGLSGIGSALFKNGELLCSEYMMLSEKATNNEAEYNALIMGLNLAIDNNIDELLVCGDSKLVISQVNGNYKINSPNLIELNNEIKNLIKHFKLINFQHVYREDNKLADYLSNLAIKDYR